MKCNTLLTVVMVAASLPFSPNAASGLRISGNLFYNADWSLQTCWVDLIHQARNWNWTTTTDQGNANNPWPWPSISYVPAEVINCPMDSDGYPLSVPVSSGGQLYRPVSAVLVEQIVSRYPYGTYTFSCEGTGTVIFGWNHRDTVNARGGVTTKQFTIRPGDITFQRTGGVSAGLLFTITSSSAADHIRNMHLIQPGWTENYAQQIFSPAFLQMCLPFSPIRAMKWTGANRGKQHAWEDRVRPTSFCQSDSEGVAYEYMIELANRTRNDLWLTVPPHADSSYFRQLALLVHATLDTSLKCWIEWANETWDGNEAEAARVCQDSGSAHGLPDPTNHYCAYNGYASVRLFKAFQDVYGSDMSRRVVKVVAGQTANSGVGSKIFAVINDARFNPWGIKPDVYAGSGYFYANGVLEADPMAGGIYGDKQVAVTNGVPYVMYEGGLASGLGPAVYTLYSNVLRSFEGTYYNFNQFCIANARVQSGDWGAYSFIGQPIDSAYKAKALVDYAKQHGWYDTTKTVLNYPMDSPAVTAGAGHPTTRMGTATFRAAYAHGMISLAGTALAGMHSVYVFNAKGGMVAGADALTTSCNLEAGFLAKGIYVVHVQALGASYSSRISVN